MTQRNVRQVALVGIDGAGKTTVSRRIFERAPQVRDRIQVVHCPSYHEDADAALGSLSRKMEAFSRGADALASFELKASALYLQMTLFGPVAAAATEAFRPEVLLCERHPVVDSLAYGPFYKQMVRKQLDADAMDRPLREALEARTPGAYEAVRRWHQGEQRRLGTDVSFWDLPHDVCAIFGEPMPDQIKALAKRYRTGLPDVVVLLDVEPAEAQRRVRARDGDAAELHESAEYLTALRQSYLGVLEGLRKAAPSVERHVIRSGDLEALDETVDALLAQLDAEAR